MKRIIVLFVMIIAVSSNSHAQIEKGYWLAGGSASINHLSYKDRDEKQLQIKLSPRVGYFLIDNLAGGINVNWSGLYRKLPGSTKKDKITELTVGPFARYYLMQVGRPFNVFVDGSVAFGSITNNNFPDISETNYSLIAGPEFYFNSSVGLEISFGYQITRTRQPQVTETSNSTFLNIGFLIHLAKE
jgi:hypothetical protein